MLREARVGGIEVMSFEEACERLGIKLSSLTVYVSQGKLVRGEEGERTVTVASVEAYEERAKAPRVAVVPKGVQPGQVLPGLTGGPVVVPAASALELATPLARESTKGEKALHRELDREVLAVEKSSAIEEVAREVFGEHAPGPSCECGEAASWAYSPELKRSVTFAEAATMVGLAHYCGEHGPNTPFQPIPDTMCVACGYDEPEHAPMCVRHPERARMIDELVAERQQEGDEVEEPVVDDDGEQLTELEAHQLAVQEEVAELPPPVTFGVSPAGAVPGGRLGDDLVEVGGAFWRTSQCRVGNHLWGYPKDATLDIEVCACCGVSSTAMEAVRRREQREGPAAVRVPDVDHVVSGQLERVFGHLEMAVAVMQRTDTTPLSVPSLAAEALGEVRMQLVARGLLNG